MNEITKKAFSIFLNDALDEIEERTSENCHFYPDTIALANDMLAYLDNCKENKAYDEESYLMADDIKQVGCEVFGCEEWGSYLAGILTDLTD